MGFQRVEEQPAAPAPAPAEAQQEGIQPNDPLALVFLMDGANRLLQGLFDRSGQLLAEAQETNNLLRQLIALQGPDECEHCGYSLDDATECPSCGEKFEEAETE